MDTHSVVSRKDYFGFLYDFLKGGDSSKCVHIKTLKHTIIVSFYKEFLDNPPAYVCHEAPKAKWHRLHSLVHMQGVNDYLVCNDKDKRELYVKTF